MGGGNLFTGIVEEIGKIAGIQKGAKSAVLTIQADKVLEDVHRRQRSLPDRHIL